MKLASDKSATDCIVFQWVVICTQQGRRRRWRWLSLSVSRSSASCGGGAKGVAHLSSNPHVSTLPLSDYVYLQLCSYTESITVQGVQEGGKKIIKLKKRRSPKCFLISELSQSPPAVVLLCS